MDLNRNPRCGNWTTTSELSFFGRRGHLWDADGRIDSSASGSPSARRDRDLPLFLYGWKTDARGLRRRTGTVPYTCKYTVKSLSYRYQVPVPQYIPRFLGAAEWYVARRPRRRRPADGGRCLPHCHSRGRLIGNACTKHANAAVPGATSAGTRRQRPPNLTPSIQSALPRVNSRHGLAPQATGSSN